MTRERVDHQAQVRQREQPDTQLERLGYVACAQGRSNTERHRRGSRACQANGVIRTRAGHTQRE